MTQPAQEKWVVWCVRADRRTADVTYIRDELNALGETFEGLVVEHLSQEEYDEAQDRGAFRDWAPVAWIKARHERVLDIAAEELVMEFGFQVDVLRDRMMTSAT